MTPYTLVGYCGVTYRQLNHWLSTGLVGDPERFKTGSGYGISLSGSEEFLLRRMAEHVQAGFTPKAAAKIAHAMLDNRTDTVRLTRFVVVQRRDGEARVEPET